LQYLEAWPPIGLRRGTTVCSSVAGRWRWRATSAKPRACRSRRSPIGSGAHPRQSRRTSTTHPRLAKDLRVAPPRTQASARRAPCTAPRCTKPPPGLSRAERTPPWRGRASPRPDPVRRSSQATRATCVRSGSRHTDAAPIGSRADSAASSGRAAARAGGRLAALRKRRAPHGRDCPQYLLCLEPLTWRSRRLFGAHNSAIEGRSGVRGRRGYRNRGERAVSSPMRAAARRLPGASCRPACASPGPCSRPAGRGEIAERVANQ
jgi:hypothetical protein